MTAWIILQGKDSETRLGADQIAAYWRRSGAPASAMGLWAAGLPPADRPESMTIELRRRRAKGRQARRPREAVAIELFLERGEKRFRCRECDNRGQIIISIEWATIRAGSRTHWE